MAAKGPQLIQQYVTGGDRSLRDWHLFLRRATFAAAIVLMLASVVSLHWACVLIGLPDKWYAPVAWIVPLAMEVGMAAVASTATTIRKDPKPGREDEPGGYYISLWLIFSFIMLLAQAANIGHALAEVEDQLAGTTVPAFIPDAAIYTFVALFAALFPLGGTLLVHVSGFLRAHGTGARWIDEDAEVVYTQAAPGAPAAAQPARAPQRAPRAPQPTPTRAPAAPTARTESAPTAQPARVEAPAPSAPDARTDAPAARTAPQGSEQEAARMIFDRMVAADPFTKPDAARIHDEAGATCNRATSRRWVQKWWDEAQAELTGQPDPIVAQVEAEQKSAAGEADEAPAESAKTEETPAA